MLGGGLNNLNTIRITGGGRVKNIREVLTGTLGLGFGLSNSNLVSHGELG